MNVLQFLRSMLPSFKRNDVTERLRVIRDDLVNQTLPPYETAASDLRNASMKSKVFIDFDKAFSSGVDSTFKGSFIDQTHLILKNLQVNFDFIESLVDKNYSQDIVVAGITYKRAQILQYIAIAGFAVDYARRVLLYVLAAEANVKAKSLVDGKERPVPEIKWLETNRGAYFRAMTVIAVKERDLAAMFDNIPDITVSDNVEETADATLMRQKIDPMNFNVIPIGVNPFHFLGVRWANWQVAKYQRAKEEKRALEFRLEQLRGQRSGEEDPRLERSIAYYEDEVNRLAAKIAKMEE